MLPRALMVILGCQMPIPTSSAPTSKNDHSHGHIFVARLQGNEGMYSQIQVSNNWTPHPLILRRTATGVDPDIEFCP